MKKIEKVIGKLQSYCSKLRDLILPAGSNRRRLAKGLYNAVKKVERTLSYHRTRIDGQFVFGIETDLNEPFIIGKGNAFLLRGWCYHTSRNLKHLYVIVNGSPFPIKNFGFIRKDVFQEHHIGSDTSDNSLTSGFWSTVPFPAIESSCNVNLSIRAVLDDGKIHEAEIGTISLEPTYKREPISIQLGDMAPADEPLVAICMTSFNPSIDLFNKQVESIIQQRHRNWICIVNDDSSHPEKFEEMQKTVKRDSRFKLYRNPANLGLNKNFEKCLSMVPEEASFIAISDQDDNWHEDKLSVLLSQFDDETFLAYSDMNIVNEKGEMVFNTYWTTRKNNFEELDLLILSNTITGASSMFKKELLDFLLPFPNMNNSFYDNTIACIALSQGKIKYVDRPLYDYYQHSNNVIGHYTPTKKWIKEHLPGFGNMLNTEHFKRILWFYYEFYFAHYPRRVVLGNVLKLRCTSSYKKNIMIERFISLENSSKSLIFQVVKDKLLRKEDITMGIDYGMLRSVIAKNIINSYFKFKNLFSEINAVDEGHPTGSIWDNSQEVYCRNNFKLYWELLPEVSKYQLKSITGKDNLHYFDYLIDFIKENIGTKNLRGLFIGCQEGNPPPEWTLIESGLFNKIEIFDIAEGLLKKQAKLTAERGIKNIEYRNLDCNYLQLEESTYDMIFAIGTIHHIEKLDTLFSQINRGLKNNGIFAMREYVGPNRFQFIEEQVFIINEILAILPEKYKQSFNGSIKSIFSNPDAKELIKIDPSESVCSQDIVPVMKEHLDVIKLDFTGGTILHPLLNDIASNFEKDDDGEAILKLLILFEKTLIKKGVLPSDYVFSMAKKRLN